MKKDMYVCMYGKWVVAVLVVFFLIGIFPVSAGSITTTIPNLCNSNPMSMAPIFYWNKSQGLIPSEAYYPEIEAYHTTYNFGAGWVSHDLFNVTNKSGGPVFFTVSVTWTWDKADPSAPTDSRYGEGMLDFLFSNVSSNLLKSLPGDLNTISIYNSTKLSGDMDYGDAYPIKLCINNPSNISPSEFPAHGFYVLHAGDWWGTFDSRLSLPGTFTTIDAGTINPPLNATLHLNIIDRSTFQSIRNSTMSLFDMTSSTWEGNYTMPNGTLTVQAPIGQYSYTGTAPGYSPATLIGNITDSGEWWLTVALLQPINASVDLDVKTADTGALIQNSQVGIYDPFWNVWRNSTSPSGMVYFTSTGANFEYPLYIGETLEVAGSAVGYLPANQTFTIAQNVTYITLALPPITAISNGSCTFIDNVFDPSNNLQTPLMGAGVSLETGASAFTSSAGTANFLNVSAGVNHTATAQASGYQTALVSFFCTNGETHMIWQPLYPVGYSPVNVTATETPPVDPNVQAADMISKFLMTMMSLAGVVALLLLLYFMRRL